MTRFHVKLPSRTLIFFFTPLTVMGTPAAFLLLPAERPRTEPGCRRTRTRGSRLFGARERLDGSDVTKSRTSKRFLHAVAKDAGIQAALEHEWDLDTYPVLTWSWRPRAFPAGADERDSATNDSALAVCMLVPHSPIRGPKAVQYIWSERVPIGTPLSSNDGLTQVQVLRTGTEKKGEWVDVRVNLLADYTRLFADGNAPKPAGIAVLTDSDDTNSTAEGDYANFRICRK